MITRARKRKQEILDTRYQEVCDGSIAKRPKEEPTTSAAEPTELLKQLHRERLSRPKPPPTSYTATPSARQFY